MFILSVFAAWIATAVNMVMMLWLWNDNIKLKAYYYKTEEYSTAAHNRTLLMTELPDDVCSEDAIRKYLGSKNIEDHPEQVLLKRDFGRVWAAHSSQIVCKKPTPGATAQRYPQIQLHGGILVHFLRILHVNI
jgi:type IV secretory pathway protease TraF